MRLAVKVAGRGRQVEINDSGNGLQFLLDGVPVSADALQISPEIYSLIVNDEVFEVRIERRANKLLAIVRGAEYPLEIVDPRLGKRQRGGTLVLEGRQQVVAPMPGKIVRVLVAAGDAVEGGQGLVVVEAMKMQNEVKSPKAGKIERLHVREGQAVNAGEPLIVIA